MADEHGKGHARHRSLLLCTKRGRARRRLDTRLHASACMRLDTKLHQSNRAEINAEPCKLWSCLQPGQGSMPLKVSFNIFNPIQSYQLTATLKQKKGALPLLSLFSLDPPAEAAASLTAAQAHLWVLAIH